MTFYILAGQIATLFLSLNLTTTLQFNESLETVIYGGVAQDLYTYLSDDKKTVVLKPYKEIDSNLTVITSSGKNYLFYLKVALSKTHVFAKIEEGRVSQSYGKILEQEDFDLFEGEKSLLVISKKKEKIIINNTEIKTKGYLSKGTPVIYNGIRIYQ